MKKLFIALGCAAAMLCSSNIFAAGTINGNLNVQLTIGNGCSVTGGSTGGSVNDFGTLNFGQYSSLANLINGQSTGTSGAVQIQCTTSLPYTVILDNGQNASGSQRRLIGGVSPSNAYISYSLFQDAARTLPWNSTGAGILSAVGTGAAVDIIVYGQVPSQTTPAQGLYSDVVLVTVNW
ncbi:Csu type fimbrial protein [Budvicia diplopodorum]|uniref:Csu type fimbrial protein n=1 Tax=Budvicia diplopodorum TaxID=1119056 RepID=UPI0013588FE7|nr:spore coat U domain-containing protein [Budvicia diplopodorum]